MNLRDFRIGWRLLVQQPAYSLVVIAGLAVGFASCFLLFGYVAFCLNFNSAVPANDSVVAVKQRFNLAPRPEWQIRAFVPLRDVALASGMAQAATIVLPLETPLRVNDTPHALALSVVDPAFAAMFDVRALEGDVEAALARPDGLALTRTGAARLFGSTPALGQAVRADSATLLVRAILPDPPANGSVTYEALVGSSSTAWPQRATALSTWRSAPVYLKLAPGASSAALTALLEQANHNSPMIQPIMNSALGQGLNGRKVADFALLPLRDAYFDPGMAASRDGARYGQRGAVAGMAAGGLLILLLASVNYVNLATVRTLRRQREIGIRKLLGASTSQLVRQFLSEAMLTAVLAAIVGLLLAWLLLPTFSDLVNRRLEGMFTPWRCLLALAFGAQVGAVAGLYPAWIAQTALPGPALAGRGNSETVDGLWVRRLLTVLQFASAMAICATALAVGWQTWYASHASPGFDPRQLLVLALPETSDKPGARAFIAQLAREPGVQGVATISEAVGRNNVMTGTTTTADGRDIPMEWKLVSPNWFAVHQLRPVHGQLFDPRQAPLPVPQDFDPRRSAAAQQLPPGTDVVLSAAAALALGYATPAVAVGKRLSDGGQIIGIAPDVRFHDLRQPPGAIVYRVQPARVLTIRTSDSFEAAYDQVALLWQRHFPNRIMDLQSQGAVLAERYADDARLVRMLGITSAVAILLAGFGIYVLSAYSVQRHRRQIVLRKLYGAGRADIALMLGREFSLLVGAGALVGLPLAALAIQNYLAAYTEHAPIGAWTLAAALALAALVALLATTRHTFAALRVAPVVALRD
ncbi:ABC transporter permease [Duganella phyllosphaerae]|uniref:Macrolide export ATP-binding/permease protein MacB n=1 Tax=Duganella phyllosphaerae TaxID=762836 RepID=A0A1E7X7I5_9BURK|nr:ABC transporter permease [Duganella phyllosphaerae]OFA09075.1 macrolide export ATP-binding/permease protein MacB [Duganella phyllosphaerae]